MIVLLLIIIIVLLAPGFMAALAALLGGALLWLWPIVALIVLAGVVRTFFYDPSKEDDGEA